MRLRERLFGPSDNEVHRRVLKWQKEIKTATAGRGLVQEISIQHGGTAIPLNLEMMCQGFSAARGGKDLHVSIKFVDGEENLILKP